MSAKGKAIRYTSFDGLLNSNTSDFLMKDDELKAMKNVWTYTLGVLEKVPGYSKMDSSQVISNEDVSGLHWYYDSANFKNYLLAISDDQLDLTIRYIAPDHSVSLWTTISGLDSTWDGYAESKVDMESFLGRTFIVGHKNGETYLPSVTVDGTAASTSDTSISNMPQGKYIVRYRDLLYVLNTKDDSKVHQSRAYYSDDPKDGEISWDNLLTKFVEFGYDDGDEITGAAEALDRLIVFKKRSMWKYDESERRKMADIGCDSYKSIIKINNVLYWFNRYGFWRWDGAEPVLISAKAQSFIDAIDQTKLDEVVATEYDGFEYRAFIGTVTVGGYTYTNAWFCWNTRKETCYIRCTRDVARSACSFMESSKRRAYFGQNNGYVMKFANKIDGLYTDNGNEIDSFFITKAYDYGMPEDAKYTTHITTFSKHGQSLKCAIDINKNDSFDSVNTSQIDRNISHADIISSGNRYKYKFHEKSDAKSFEFEGFVVSTDLKEHEF